MRNKISILLTSLLLASFPSCVKTEILGMSEPYEPLDTVLTKARRNPPEPGPPRDTTNERVPIGWNPSVEEWTDINQDLID